MSPAKGTPKNEIDERLAQLRDEMLQEGESLVAQEMGDQGQAIILTNSRIFVVKAGLTATGQLNGQKTKAFMLTEVESVRVRRGPMGAVIQIIDPTVAACNEVPPDNIVIFSGENRIKKCEAIAALIESALGKALERFGPKTEKEPKKSVVMDLKPKPRAKRTTKKTVTTEDIEAVKPVETVNLEPEMFPEQSSATPDLDTLLKIEAAKPKQTRKAKPKTLTTSDYDFVNDIVEEIVKAAESDTKLEPIDTKSESPSIGIPESARQPKKVHMSLAEEMYAEITSSEEYTAEVTSPIPAHRSVYTPPFDEITHIEPEIESDKKIESLKPEELESKNESSEAYFETSVQTHHEISLPELSEPVETSAANKVADLIYDIPKNTLDDEIDQFRPNPLLPRPSQHKSNNKIRMLVLLVLLAIIVLFGLAINKINSYQVPIKTKTNVSKLTKSTDGVKEQLAAISSFKTSALLIVNAASNAASSLVSHLKSGNCSYSFAVAQLSIIDKSSSNISALDPPVGLSEVKDQLTSSLFDLKNMADIVSNGIKSGSDIDIASAERATAGAKRQIDHAVTAISNIESDLRKKIESAK